MHTADLIHNKSSYAIWKYHPLSFFWEIQNWQETGSLIAEFWPEPAIWAFETFRKCSQRAQWPLDLPRDPRCYYDLFCPLRVSCGAAHLNQIPKKIFTEQTVRNRPCGTLISPSVTLVCDYRSYKNPSAKMVYPDTSKRPHRLLRDLWCCNNHPNSVSMSVPALILAQWQSTCF